MHKHEQQEAHTAKSIRSKLKRNNATIAKTDKGNSLVIIPSKQYEDKIQNFVDNNKFHVTDTDPTNLSRTKSVKL
jgi:hypothetical protein